MSTAIEQDFYRKLHHKYQELIVEFMLDNGHLKPHEETRLAMMAGCMMAKEFPQLTTNEIAAIWKYVLQMPKDN